jgi:hypothetical protein
MKKQMLRILLSLLILSALAACAPSTEPAAPETAVPQPGYPAAQPDLIGEPYPALPQEDPMDDSDVQLPGAIDDLPPRLTPLPEEGPPHGVIGEVAESLLEQIVADAATRSGQPAADITIVRAEETIWNDGSLGCPEPGMMYTMALVEGYWIVLEVDGKTYDYRATQSGTFRLCENPPVEK